MIKVSQALRIILNSVKGIDSECVSLVDAQARVLSEDIYAGECIPGFDNSAMDEYAIASVDSKGASKDSPKILKVCSVLKAGDVPAAILKPNQAMRIMTGAQLPRGADSVVMVEDTQIKSEIRNPKSETNSKFQIQNPKPRKKEYIEIFKEAKPGENIRKAGEDVKSGELVISSGTLLKPAHIGLLASLGKTKVKVTRRPKVAIVATGDEVMDVKGKLKPGKIRSSNTYTLCAQIIKSGGIPKNLGIARDRFSELEKRIKLGLDCDLIITSGGVSVGDYDLVKDVLAAIGTKIKFWKIAIRPGKPLVFGTLSATK